MNNPYTNDPHRPASLAVRTSPTFRPVALVLGAVLALTAADGAFARHRDKTRNTLIGAGLGAAGGALISHGDVWGTLGGAAAGGLIGNAVSHDDHRRRDWDRHGRDRRDWRDDRHHHH